MRLILLRALLAALHVVRTRGPATLAVIAIVVLAVGPYAFGVEARATGARVAWHEGLYYTFGLFTLQGNRFGYPHTPLLTALIFIAPLVSASAILGAILELLERRAPLLVRRFRTHTVIGGLGNLGATIARHESQHGQLVVAVDREGKAREVENLRSSGAGVILVGDMTSAALLRQARAHLARRVFLTGGSDLANLDAAFNVRRLARQLGVQHPPSIFAHVYDAHLATSLERMLGACQPGDAPIVPFNSYRFAAKALIAVLLRNRMIESRRIAPGWRLERTASPDDDGPAIEPVPDRALAEDRRRLLRAFRLAPEPAAPPEERYAVVGLGRFGRSVVHELLEAAPRSARFLVVERSADTVAAVLDELDPSDRERIEALIGDSTQPPARARLLELAPRVVILCTDSDLNNLRLALELQRSAVRVVTRMFDLEASPELRRGLQERGIAAVGLARLFRAAIPIVTQERRLRACLDLDVHGTPDVDHLFYAAEVSDGERRRLGAACVGLDELPRAPAADDGAAVPPLPAHLALVWYRAVQRLDDTIAAADSVRGDADRAPA